MTFPLNPRILGDVERRVMLFVATTRRIYVALSLLCRPFHTKIRIDQNSRLETVPLTQRWIVPLDNPSSDRFALSRSLPSRSGFFG
ncbi:hypothetical protein BN77_p10889 [Rhizobium mesoamericanum STM3625]|uniref:Uncharacterized protein n=1 Tax=Rhizobium mesoamericanum STM3625 TaxID=1211777 RepID=K0Q577_9HYPH|nr:hypothetical protein BN77_p10889 [Rhizobium mesoamericanum STM3625]